MPKLISFSLVAIVPPPFKTEYIAGIAEDDQGKRIPIRIEREHLDILKIGMTGTLEKKQTDLGEFTYFLPKIEKSSKKKVALITGSTRGIGKAIAIELAKNGYDIAINDLELPDEGKEAIKAIDEMGRNSIFVKANVADYSDVEKMINEILIKFKRIDVLVNNAGINIDKLVTNMNPQDWQRVIDVNLTGVFNCTKAVIPNMIKIGGGKIINMSSQGALDGPVGQANYAASKGGIISFTKVIAKEYAQYNILCNAIAPGCIETRMTDSMPPGMLRERVSEIPLGRRGKPREVAELVTFLADQADYITGQLILINAGEYI
ncbi:MAG: 3-oxoacyl-ACP reductase FabG [Candidatus Bathyarchaeota archaeon]|nr:3-oxoacyl-ACP reductase FabG [Candidatus Bathyarchaeota archaeon]